MKNSVIAIFGVPRTGTSWLGEIFDSCEAVIYKYQPLFSYRFKDRLNARSSSEDIGIFLEELRNAEDDFLNQTQMRNYGYYPVFNKKFKESSTLVFKEVRYLYLIPHLLQRTENLKAIMLLRDPIETMESWINAPSEYKEEWNIYEEWYYAIKKNEYFPENYYGFAKWKEARSLFLNMQKQYSKRAAVIEYSELCNNTLEVVKNLFHFCDLEMSNQTLTFIQESQSCTKDNAYSVFRKKDERIKKERYLPTDIKQWILEECEFSEQFLPKC